MLSCWKLLGVRSSVLEIRSKSGNDVPINLHQTNVTLCSDKKGEGPKAQLSPFEVQAWLREGVPCGGRGRGYPVQECSSSTQSGSSRQCPGLAEEAVLSWWLPQGQVLRPCPAAVIAEGTRPPGPSWPSVSSGRPNSGGQVPQTVSHADCLCH